MRRCMNFYLQVYLSDRLLILLTLTGHTNVLWSLRVRCAILRYNREQHYSPDDEIQSVYIYLGVANAQPISTVESRSLSLFIVSTLPNFRKKQFFSS